nr:zinc finger, CCHC-type [Tanacetum cinerariifolium]
MQVQQELPSQATASWSGSKTITLTQEEDDTTKKCMEVLPAWTGSKIAIPTQNRNNTIQECMELLLRRIPEIQRLASKFIERPERDDQILVMSHPRMYVERFSRNLFVCHKVLGVSVLSFKGDKVLQEVQLQGFGLKKEFVEYMFKSVFDLRWNCSELRKIVKLRYSGELRSCYSGSKKVEDYMRFAYESKDEIYTKGLLDESKEIILGMEMFGTQSGNTLKVSRFRFSNGMSVQILLDGHSTLLLDGGTHDKGCGYFMWMDDLRLYLSSSSGPSTPPSSYPRPSTRPSYSLGPFGSALYLGKVEFSNCKFLAEKIKTLEAKIKILEGTLEMERHPKNHTLESAVILYELYNDMGNM